MKVVIINSSPRINGNSHVLCRQFAKGAIESGHEAEIISLCEKKIAPCKACYGCSRSHVCVQKDDMEEIFHDLQQADVIVLASPVYFYSISGPLKIMIDRCLVDHKSLKNKKFYFIVTAADPRREAIEATLRSMREFMKCLPEATEEKVICGAGMWDAGDVYRHRAYEIAYETGKRIGI